MNIKEETIIRPLPNDEIISEKEKKWHVNLPTSFKCFIKKYNGGVPDEQTFIHNKHSYAIVRFLGIIKDIQSSDMGWYDIGVVESQIGERLTDNLDLIGMEVVPIAEMYAGDYLCMDFRKNKVEPTICIWYHEESGEFSPMTEKVADDFSQFLNMLTE